MGVSAAVADSTPGTLWSPSGPGRGRRRGAATGLVGAVGCQPVSDCAAYTGHTTWTKGFVIHVTCGLGRLSGTVVRLCPCRLRDRPRWCGQECPDPAVTSWCAGSWWASDAVAHEPGSRHRSCAEAGRAKDARVVAPNPVMVERERPAAPSWAPPPRHPVRVHGRGRLPLRSAATTPAGRAGPGRVRHVGDQRDQPPAGDRTALA